MESPSRIPLVLLVVVVGVFILFMLPFSPSTESENKKKKPKVSGHQQMLKKLEAIATSSQNPYFGDAFINRIRAHLLGARPGSPQELLLRFDLGSEELRRGGTESAVEQLKRCYDLIPQVSDSIEPDKIVEVRKTTTFLLAVAYLRLGENENCINCHTSESCIFPLDGEGIHEKREGSEKAIPYLEEVLALAPDDAAARWLLNLAHMTLGSYPKAVPEKFLIKPDLFKSEEEFPRFNDIAKQVGLNTRSLCGGAISDDFNGDGLLDIVVSNWDPAGQLKYFINTGKGKFTDQTKKAGLIGLSGGLNINQTDYNNDGHPDIYVMRGGWLAEQGRYPNSLIRNNGDGTFTDVTIEAGLAKENFPTQPSSWADYNNDGKSQYGTGHDYFW